MNVSSASTRAEVSIGGVTPPVSVGAVSRYSFPYPESSYYSVRFGHQCRAPAVERDDGRSAATVAGPGSAMDDGDGRCEKYQSLGKGCGDGSCGKRSAGISSFNKEEEDSWSRLRVRGEHSSVSSGSSEKDDGASGGACSSQVVVGRLKGSPDVSGPQGQVSVSKLFRREDSPTSASTAEDILAACQAALCKAEAVFQAQSSALLERIEKKIFSLECHVKENAEEIQKIQVTVAEAIQVSSAEEGSDSEGSVQEQKAWQQAVGLRTRQAEKHFMQT